MIRNGTNILHKEISYILQGCIFAVRKEYGSGHKETVYKNLLADFLTAKNVKIEKEKAITIYSSRSGKVVGSYRPDLVVDDKIVVEIKATRFPIAQNLKQLDDYLKNSTYEVGYLINFGTAHLYMIRRIHTNDRKQFRVA